MKKLVFISILYFLTLSLSIGQTNNHKQIGKKRSLYIENTEAIQVAQKPAVESPYFGYDNKIKEISLSNAIPSGFPTKEGFADKTQYKTAINKWIKENPSFIKPEFKNTLIND